MDLNASDGVQIGVGVVLTLTLGAVLWYACEARKQAKAANAMADEMRQQRLGEQMPLVLMDADRLNFSTGGRKPGPDRRVEDCYPDMIKVRLINVGSGPAIDIDITAIHPKAHYSRSATKGYLLPGESTDYETTESIYPPTGRGLSELLADCRVNVESGYSVGVVARYRDVHERTWVTWLALDYDWDLGGRDNQQIIWWLNSAGQHIATLPDEGRPQSDAIFFGVGVGGGQDSPSD
jgi:hypothetical protein